MRVSGSELVSKQQQRERERGAVREREMEGIVLFYEGLSRIP